MKIRRPKEINIAKKVISCELGEAWIEDGKFLCWGEYEVMGLGTRQIIDLSAREMNDDYIDKWLSFLLTIKFALKEG